MSQTPQLPRRVLIVGASDGDRVMSFARSVPSGGMMICIEGDRAAAARAVAAFAREGLSGRVSVMIGDPALFVGKVAGPFDLIVTAVGEAVRARIAARLDALLAPGGRILTA